jgi:hypothetical protein
VIAGRWVGNTPSWSHVTPPKSAGLNQAGWEVLPGINAGVHGKPRHRVGDSNEPFGTAMDWAHRGRLGDQRCQRRADGAGRVTEMRSAYQDGKVARDLGIHK